MMKLTNAAILMLLLSGANTANAGVTNTMKDVFDGMVTYSTARATNTATQNGVTLGAASFRVRQVQQNIATFTQPSLRGGCGGVDFFAGGFSVINSDQLVQMGRAIIQGAASYAFELALSSTCPSCAGVMKNLQSKLDGFNKMAADGCKSAVSFLKDNESTVESAMRVGWLDDMAIDVNESSWFSDPLDKKAASNNTGNAKAKADLAGIDLENNIVWELLKAAKMDAWASSIPSFTGTELMEFIMSMTGTVIVVSNGDTSSDSSGIDKNKIEKLLTMRDFILGVKPDDFSVYDCDEPLQCMSPTVVVKTDWKGLVPLYAETISSAISKVQDRSGVALTTEELALAESAGLNYSDMISGLKGSSANSIGKLAAILATRRVVSDIVHNFNNIVIPAALGSRSTMSPEVKMALGEVEGRFKALKDEMDSALEEHSQSIKTQRDGIQLISLIKGFSRKTT